MEDLDNQEHQEGEKKSETPIIPFSNIDESKQPRHLSQVMLSRVLTLEEENKKLKNEMFDLKQSYRALVSKNKLFQAKILELQARLLNPQKHAEKYRSPFVFHEDGSVVYRFERPQSARVEPSSAPLSSQHPRDPVSAREMTKLAALRSTVPRLPISTRLAKQATPISANPAATERVLSELERSTRPSPYTSSLQRKLTTSARYPTTAAARHESPNASEPVSAPSPAVEGLERLTADLERSSFHNDSESDDYYHESQTITKVRPRLEQGAGATGVARGAARGLLCGGRGPRRFGAAPAGALRAGAWIPAIQFSHLHSTLDSTRQLMTFLTVRSWRLCWFEFSYSSVPFLATWQFAFMHSRRVISDIVTGCHH